MEEFRAFFVLWKKSEQYSHSNPHEMNSGFHNSILYFYRTAACVLKGIASESCRAGTGYKRKYHKDEGKKGMLYIGVDLGTSSLRRGESHHIRCGNR